MVLNYIQFILLQVYLLIDIYNVHTLSPSLVMRDSSLSSEEELSPSLPLGPGSLYLARLLKRGPSELMIFMAVASAPYIFYPPAYHYNLLWVSSFPLFGKIHSHIPWIETSDAHCTHSRKKNKRNSQPVSTE